MKAFVRQTLRTMGYQILPITSASNAGSDRRPICNIKLFLEGIRSRSFIPSSILDVGANQGDWTRMAKDVFPEASFLLIEPQLEMRKSLDTLCTEFQDILWIEAGVGSKEGRMVQTIYDDLAASSFLPAPNEDLLQSGKQREVSIVTIDSLLEKKNHYYSRSRQA